MKYLILIGCLSLTTPILNAGETGVAPATRPVPEGESTFTGKVAETMNTAGYSYVLVDTGTNKLWAAGTECVVKVGDNVTVVQGMPMSNYHSKSLNRDFEVVYFTGALKVNGQTGQAGDEAAATLPAGHPPIGGKSVTAGAAASPLPAGHPPLSEKATSPGLDLTGIQKAPGGRTVAEIYAASASLVGKEVVLRGKVVKYNAAILGKNWVHVRDGSGSPEKKDFDLMITTTNTAKVGEVVLVRGLVAANRDFGAGYKYSLMLENATVTKEQ